MLYISEVHNININNNLFLRLLFSSDNLQLTSPKKKVKIINTTRFDDLNSSDYSTPRRAKINLNLSKLTVANLRKKNKLLRQKNKRLS
jgi:hypothetical protein